MMTKWPRQGVVRRWSGWRVCVVASGLVWGSVLGGCASERSAAPRASGSGNAYSGAEAAEWSATQLVLVAGESREYVSKLEGESDRLRVRIDAAPGEESVGERWVVTRETLAADGTAKRRGRRVQVWVRGADGSISLAEETNEQEQVIVRFEPAMVIYPARIGVSERAAAQSVESDGSNDVSPGVVQATYVRVHPMKNPERIRVEGPATQRVWYEGRETVQAADRAARTRTVERIRSVCEIDFGVSRSVNESVVWIDEREGVAREWRRERASALGVNVRDKTEEWVWLGGEAVRDAGR